jgi:hypothetical protein
MGVRWCCCKEQAVVMVAMLPTTGVLAAKYEVGNNAILWLLLFSGFTNLV